MMTKQVLERAPKELNEERRVCPASRSPSKHRKRSSRACKQHRRLYGLDIVTALDERLSREMHLTCATKKFAKGPRSALERAQRRIEFQHGDKRQRVHRRSRCC